MSKSARFRFAFAITDGPNAGLSCSGWRVWAHGESTYMASTGTGGMWKLSLHGDAAWRYAQTSEDRRSGRPVLPVGHDRAPWKFTPSPFVNGSRVAFVIAVARGAMLPQPVDPSETVIPVEDRWDRLPNVCIHHTLPGHKLRTTRLPIGQPLTLDSGRQVWLTAGSEAVDPTPPEKQAVGAMIEPLSPETHGVAWPGLIVRGVHVD